MSRATHEAVYEARHPLDLVADGPVDGSPDVPTRVVSPIPSPASITRGAIAVSRVSADRVYHENGTDQQTTDGHAF